MGPPARLLSSMAGYQSTYRVQLSRAFPFAAARADAPYLADLGGSHLYTSPILRARSGSTHGYDMVDPTQVAPELGGEAGLRELVAALRAAGMGLVVDLVPNHMATSNESPWWVETLRHGRDAAVARVFDIDWEAGGGRVRLPVLGGPLDRVADQVRVDGGWVVYHEHRFPLAPGTDRLDQQHYELVDWRRAAVDLNYRRFFTVNELIGVRQEDPEVYRMTHATILRLAAEGLVDGVRVDHIDGLADPAAYLRRLAASVPYVVVEKILEDGERLPDWPVAGTTGYEFLAMADGVLIDRAAAGAFAEGYRDLTGDDPDPAAVALACKRERLERDFGAEVAGVARHLPGDQDANRAAVVELAARLPVYRTYVTTTVSDTDRAVIAEAAEAARPALSPAGASARDRLVAALLLELPAPEAVRRFQQLSGPAMAKGVEDTALYRDTRLVARNEVGGDLGRFGRPLAGEPARQLQPRHQAGRGRARPPGRAQRVPRPLVAPGRALDRPPRRRGRPGRRPAAVADHGRGLAPGARALPGLHGEGGPGGRPPHHLDRPRPGLRAGPGRPGRPRLHRPGAPVRAGGPGRRDRPRRPCQGGRPGPAPPDQPRRPRHLPGHRDRAAGPGRPRQPPPRPLHRRRFPEVPGHPHHPPPPPRPPRPVHRLPPPRRPRRAGRLRPRQRPPGRGRHLPDRPGRAPRPHRPPRRPPAHRPGRGPPWLPAYRPDRPPPGSLARPPLRHRPLRRPHPRRPAPRRAAARAAGSRLKRPE